MINRRWAYGVCVAVATLGGCSRRVDDQWTRQRPPVYPATGLVTYANQPVAGATVMFESAAEDPKAAGKVAVGHTDAAGRFCMNTFREYEGVVAGPHRVSIKKMEYFPAPRPAKSDPSADVPLLSKSVLPEKYCEFSTSGLSVIVTPDGPNQFGLSLE